MEKATYWVEQWGRQEGNTFTGFTDFIATRLTGAINASIIELQRRRLAAGKSAKLEVPWGIFDAKIKVVGEGSNITPTYEPTERFMNLLNGDEKDADEEQQANIDAEYLKMVQDWLAYGEFDADTKTDRPAKEKGTRIDITEIEYFLHSYMRLMVSIAKDHQRDGKSYILKFMEEIDFGEFTFDYKDDDITPKFTASKVYKQSLKNDSVLEASEASALAAYAGNNVGTTIVNMAACANFMAFKSAMKTDKDGFKMLVRK